MHTQQRLNALTSLRFFSAAMIVFLHIRTLELFGINKNQNFYVNLGQGVSFFFVLSGFILAYIYPKLETWSEIRRFLHARIARIWPALAVSTFLAIWLLSLGWSYKTGLANLFMVNAWIPYPIYFFSYNSPSWSISTEFFFYLLFPLLIYQWRSSWHIKLGAAVILVASLIALSNWLQLPGYASINDESITRDALLYIHPLSRILEFIFGICIASYWQQKMPLTQWKESRATLYEIAVILLAGLSMHYISHLAVWAGTSWLGQATKFWLNVGGSMFAFGLLIYVMAMGRGRISRWLSHPMLVLLGEISFSIYLLHQILLRYYFVNIAAFTDLPNLLSLTYFWVVVLLASYLMWSLVEMPCRHLILGRQNKMYGTQVMRKSWRNHLNLNRETLSAAIVLICLVTTINFSINSLSNNPNRIKQQEADSMTPSALKYLVGTRFGNQFLLRGAEVVSKPEGLLIRLAWESLVEQELTYTTRLYLTDVNGNNLYFVSLKQPKTKTTEKSGAIWSETILMPADKLSGLERKLAISLYQISNDPLYVDRGDRDRDNHRLLVDLRHVEFPKSL